MFNLFKKKVALKSSNVLINSIDYKHGIKLGSQISVPSNFECLIFSKGKFYTTLSEGKYIIDKDLLPQLVKRQQKQSKKIKKVKLIAHFVSNSNHQVQIKAKKQKYEVSFCIKDKLKFLDLLLTFTYKINDLYAINYLGEIFVELLTYNKFAHKAIQSSALDSHGICINSFNPMGTKNSIFTSKEFESKPLAAPEPKTSNITNQTTDNYHINEPNDTPSAAKAESSYSTHKSALKQYTCPHCGQSTKFKTSYCIKCGSTLQN